MWWHESVPRRHSRQLVDICPTSHRRHKWFGANYTHVIRISPLLPTQSSANGVKVRRIFGACRATHESHGPLAPHHIGTSDTGWLESTPWTKSSPLRPKPSTGSSTAPPWPSAGSGSAASRACSSRRSTTRGCSDLEVISNNCGVDDWGLGILLKDKRIRRMVSSYVGENKEFERQYLAGRARGRADPAGHAGRAAARRRRPASPRSSPRPAPAPRSPTADCPGCMPRTALSRRPHLPRRRRLRGRRRGARVRPRAARSWPTSGWCAPGRATGTATSSSTSPPATSTRSPRWPGRVTIAEVEELVEPGELDPDQVHLPGIYVHRVLPLTPSRPRTSGSSGAPSTAPHRAERTAYATDATNGQGPEHGTDP